MRGVCQDEKERGVDAEEFAMKDFDVWLFTLISTCLSQFREIYIWMSMADVGVFSFHQRDRFRGQPW